MFPPSGFGYDRAITIFAPNGRLYQVEYSLEAVRRGTTAIGIRAKDGVVLVVEKRVTSLQESETIEKVFIVDEHVGAAIAGLTADARILIDNARLEAQTNKFLYDEPIDVELLTKKICDIKQAYTQRAGVRPFGVSLLIAGVDKEPQLFITDPSGAYWGYKAAAIGSGSQEVKTELEKDYKDDITLDEAVNLALRILKKVSKQKLDADHVEIACVSLKDKKFRILTSEEKMKYISKLAEKDEKSKNKGSK